MSTINPEIAEEFKRIFEQEPNTVAIWQKWADIELKSPGKYIPVGHVNSSDIVGDLILKTIDGNRTWEKDKLPLNVYMYNNIKSEVSNIKTHEKKRLYITTNNDQDDDFNEEEVLSKVALTEEDISNPDFVTDIENRELLELMEKEIEKDFECSILFEAMKECDPKKNEELAKLTGYTVEKIENTKKRLFRKLNIITAKYRN